jgi:hypothetical protein
MSNAERVPEVMSASELAPSWIDWIGAIANVATTLAAIAAAVTLYLGWRQIKSANRDIQANMAYNILKDGRDLFIATQTFADTKKCIGPVCNFYASAYHQWKLGTLSDHQWAPIKCELKILANNSDFVDFWNEERKTMFPVDFVAYIEQIKKD